MLLSPDSKLKDFVQLKEDVFSEELCNELIKEYENDAWNRAVTFSGRPNVRTNQQLQISFLEILNKNHRRHELDHIIFKHMENLAGAYAQQFEGHLNYEQDAGYALLKYQKGEYYQEHCDDSTKVTFDENGVPVASTLTKRKITIIIQLNDDFSGGGLSFFDGTLKMPVKKGSALLFPSIFMFPHQALPVEEGTRYSLITWID